MSLCFLLLKHLLVEDSHELLINIKTYTAGCMLDNIFYDYVIHALRVCNHALLCCTQ